MNNSQTVCAVISTYNRKLLLSECIEALLSVGSEALKCIVVVDNDSTDDTKDYLRSHPKLIASCNVLDFEKSFENFNTSEDLRKEIGLIYVDLCENLGGAGGFHYGLKLATKLGFDWYWLMDDDVAPEFGCLEKLLDKSGISQCIHPLKRYVDGTSYNWDGYFNPVKGNSVYLSNLGLRNKSLTFVNYGNFEGMLISKEVVGKIGLPDKRFFICGDDLIYGWLASLHTNVSFTSDAVIVRKKSPGLDLRMSNFTLFYYLRNGHLLLEYMSTYMPSGNNVARRFFFISIFVKEFVNSFRYFSLNNLGESFKRFLVIIKAFFEYIKKSTGRYEGFL